MDDPRLTAYALGELDGEERRKMEALVALSAEAREAVEEVRRTAAMLEGELAKEPAAMLGEARHAVMAKLVQEKRPHIAREQKAWRWWFTPVTVAASTAIVFFVFWMGTGELGERNTKNKELQVAIGPEALEQGAQNVLPIAPAENQLTDAGKGLLRRIEASNEVDGSSLKSSRLSLSYEDMKAGVLSDGVSDLKTGLPQGTISKKGTEVFSSKSGRGRFVMRSDDAWAQASANNPAAEQFISPSTTASPSFSADAEDKLKALLAPSQLAQSDAGKENLAFEGSPEQLREIEELLQRIQGEPGEGRRTWSESTNESYDGVVDNPFFAVLQSPLSTFSIDVDTASYANIRRMLNSNQLPPASAVRIEEMVNYFSYDYPQPEGDRPFSVNIETASCPWKSEHRLVRVGLKGREVPQEKRLPCNLVFLIDVSGSMNEPNKLPLVKQGLAMLVQRLSENDRVAMVVYAGASGLALPSTPVTQKQAILDTIEHLEAGGSTNGGEGIQLAYKIAGENFDKEGVNRVILATDGDFNVGVTTQNDLVKLVEEKARGGVFLSVLGFGMGNLKDSTLEKLADKGNGNYAYIDTFAEAKKVLVDQMAGTLVTIAKDVKIQIEFNPGQVASYRLIGYENRILAARDFNDDKKDAGEIGAGHTVTALYEIVPTLASTVGVDPLKYQTMEGARRDSRTSEDDGDARKDSRASDAPKSGSDELLTLKLRYKRPDGDTSQLIETPVKDSQRSFDEASDDLRFAASVAGFGMMLRNSPHKGDWTYDAVLAAATRSMGKDASGYRAEFVDLVRKAKGLSGGR